jgi:hypothetical protein
MTKADWQQARRDLLEEGRKRVGPPPPVETVEALLRGELPAAEAERVRAVLAYYPELVRVMTANPIENDEPVLTESEKNADLERLRQSFASQSRRPAPSRARTFALAAGIVIAVAIAGGVMMRIRPNPPRAVVTKVLSADEERLERGAGGVPDIILAPSTDYLLKPLYRPDREYRDYRFELLDLRAAPSHSLWIRENIKRQPDGSFPTSISTSDLEPGRYELILSGDANRLATYTFRVESR